MRLPLLVVLGLACVVPIARADPLFPGSKNRALPHDQAVYARFGFDGAMAVTVGYARILPTRLAVLRGETRAELLVPFGGLDLGDHAVRVEGAFWLSVRSPFALRFGLSLDERATRNRAYDVVTFGTTTRLLAALRFDRGVIGAEASASFAPIAHVDTTAWYAAYVNDAAHDGFYRTGSRSFVVALRGSFAAGPIEAGGTLGYAFYGQYDFLPSPRLDLFVAGRFPAR